MKQRLLTRTLNRDGVLGGLNRSELDIRAERLPPGLKRVEIIEVDHQVTRPLGRPKHLDETITGDTVTISKKSGHLS